MRLMKNRSKTQLALSALLVLPAVAGVAIVGSISLGGTSNADIGPIPFPPIPILGGGGATATATATGTPRPSTSASPSPSASPRPSTSASPSASPRPSVTPSPSPSIAPRPRLGQDSQNGSVLFTVIVDSRYAGNTVYFFRRSGQTGQVAPLGTAVVGNSGYGFRQLNGLKPGQIIYAYCKLMGASDIADPYSNDVAFKVK